MAWIIFESIEFNDKLKSSRTGKTYSGYVLKGEKKGFPQGEPNVPFEKILFENKAVTVIEKGVARPGISVVQFFQKAVKPGDTVIMKSNRTRSGWELASVENITAGRVANAVKDYSPVTDEEAASAAVEFADPTRPAAPQTPHTRPLNYTYSE